MEGISLRSWTSITVLSIFIYKDKDYGPKLRGYNKFNASILTIGFFYYEICSKLKEILAGLRNYFKQSQYCR